MSWSAASVAVLAVNVLAKLALDAGGVAAGGTAAALSSSILLSLGLTLLGEAAVVWFRAQSLASAGGPAHRGPGSEQYRGAVQHPDRPTQLAPDPVSQSSGQHLPLPLRGSLRPGGAARRPGHHRRDGVHRPAPPVPHGPRTGDPRQPGRWPPAPRWPSPWSPADRRAAGAGRCSAR